MKQLVAGLYFVLILTIVMGCGGSDTGNSTQSTSSYSSKTSNVAKNTRSKYQQQAIDIMGVWYLNEWDLYHTIRFIDKKRVEFYTHIDTVLTYDYEMRPDSLLIYNERGDRLYINIIGHLTRDTLVFENLMEKSGMKHYSRKSKQEVYHNASKKK